MREYISKNKPVIFILASSLFLGIFVRVWNLSDVRFFNPDEYAPIYQSIPLIYNKYPFLHLVYRIPVLLWGRYQAVVLYTTAFWGIFSILMVFMVGKVLFNDKVGCYSALILSLLGLHVRFSRTGYAAIFQSFLLLILFLLFPLYLKENKPRYPYIVLTGILLSLIFLTYAASYGAIATVFILFFIILKARGLSLKRIIAILVILGCSSLMVFILIEIIGRINTGSYLLGNLYGYQGRLVGVDSASIARIGKFNLFISLISLKGISADGGILQLWLIIIGFIYCIIDWFRKRDNHLFLLVGFIGISYLIYTIMSLLSFHVMLPRRLVYLTPFLSISSAYLLYRIERVTNKYFVITFLIIFSLFSFPKCVKIIRNSFKINHITEWIEQHKISKDKIVTRLDIYENGDVLKTVQTPGRYTKVPYTDFKIDWERIKELYRQGKIQYILTSGIGSDSTVGYNDSILKRFKPLKTWSHPYHLKYPENKRIQDFALYELTDIIADLED